MRQAFSARNVVVGLAGFVTFVAFVAERFLHRHEFLPVMFAGGGALVVAEWFGRRAAKRHMRTLLRSAHRWGWIEGPTPTWAAEAKVYPLWHPQEMGVSGCLRGVFRGAWITSFLVTVKPKYVRAYGDQEFHVIGLPVAEWVPRVLIVPVGRTKVAYEMLGATGIDFESAAFNARWRVTGDEGRKVHDVVHPRMIERLLRPDACDVPVIVAGGAVWTWRAGRVSGRELERVVNVLYDFAAGVPAFLDEEGRGVLIPCRSGSMEDDITRANEPWPPPGAAAPRG